mgnify:CR=1 FL=1
MRRPSKLTINKEKPKVQLGAAGNGASSSKRTAMHKKWRASIREHTSYQRETETSQHDNKNKHTET